MRHGQKKKPAQVQSLYTEFDGVIMASRTQYIIFQDTTESSVQRSPQDSPHVYINERSTLYRGNFVAIRICMDMP